MASNPNTVGMGKRKQIKVSDQLRAVIDGCGMTRYQLAKLTGIDESALARFMSAERGLSMRALDKLGEALGLEVVMPGGKRS